MQETPDPLSSDSIIPEKKAPVDFPRLAAAWLGRVGYEEAYRIQRSIHAERLAEKSGDRLLLLEHPTVVTVPRRSEEKNLLLSKDLLEAKGAQIVSTDRGGEVTLHNPGQLVGYLICRLGPGGRDLHSLIRGIEQRLASVAKSFGVDAHCRKGLTGLWVEERKIASIGIAVKRWTTLHGFAINVNNDLEPFNWIVPCGLAGVRMTSLAVERGHAIYWPRLLEETCAAFGAEWEDH